MFNVENVEMPLKYFGLARLVLKLGTKEALEWLIESVSNYQKS